MTIIRPFKGLRPTKELVKDIASLPYDVLDTEEARAEIAKRPLSFLTVTKSEATMPKGIKASSEEVYVKAKENLDKYIHEGKMVQDSSPSYYIYREQMGSFIQIGLVVAASVEEYSKNIIKKHELTREDKEQDRVEHIMATRAQTGPVFLTYKNRGQIDALILQIMSDKEPVFDFVAEDGVKHTLYVVDAPLVVAEITKLFASVPNLYIADGHHRSAAAMRVAQMLKKRSGQTGEEEYNYFLAVIFPDNMLHILAYNRLVKDLNGMSTEEFFGALKEKFEVAEELHDHLPKKKHAFGMYIEGKWYTLISKEEIVNQGDPIKSLDVSILQDNVLEPLFGIKNPRTDERISFMGGIRGLEALATKVDNGEYKVAFALYPTSMEELINVADNDLIMPPKSTWFEPKLRDAMVVHLIGDEENA